MILAVNFWDSVVAFFLSIWEFVQLVAKLVSNTLNSLVYALEFLFTAQLSLNVVINYLPAVVSGACLAFVAVGVLRFILGK